jgi:putative lipoprotein
MRRTSLALCLLLVAGPVRADEWLGQDKALHLGASAALSSGGYLGASLLTESVPLRMASGAALALSLGLAKEVHDERFSGKDMAWNALGTATGLLLSWTVDVALRRLLR